MTAKPKQSRPGDGAVHKASIGQGAPGGVGSGERVFPWKRFWADRGKAEFDEHGFLVDADDDFGAIQFPHLKPLPELANLPLVILLGPSGIGKSHEIACEVERLQQAGRTAQVIQLGTVTGRQDLAERVFEARWFRESGATEPLTVFLDGFDECLVNFRQLGNILVEELTRFPSGSLRLRVVCRTSEWPCELENRLAKAMKHDVPTMVEMLPLRRADVEAAARDSHIDPDAFLQQVVSRQVGPLAALPVTLALLISEMETRGTLPDSRGQLYESGCRRLCEELNTSRLSAGPTNALSLEQRAEGAMLVAGLLLLRGKQSVRNYEDACDDPKTHLTLSDLVAVSRSQTILGTSAPSSIAEWKEVLATGLFSASEGGSGELSFVHRSFAEYLAARFLQTFKMNQRQLTSLFSGGGITPDDVVPQLSGFAAWLAGMVPTFREWLLTRAPLTLLRSDLASTNDAERAELASAILKWFGEEKSLDRQVAHSDYGKLAHPGLSDQLRVIIGDKKQGWLVRRVAIDIADACSRSDLDDLLAEVFLDAADKRPTRIHAGWALSRIGKKPARKRMAAALNLEPADDPDDQLKGYALAALWPDQLSLTELLKVLSRPQKSLFIGGYQAFLYRFSREISESDVPALLQWFGRQGTTRFPDTFRELGDSILALAFKNLDRDEVFGSLTGHLHQLIHGQDNRWLYRGASIARLIAECSCRQDLIRALIARGSRREKTKNQFIDALRELTRSEDVPWLVSLLDVITAETQRGIVCQVIEWHFSMADPDSWNDAIVSSARHKDLRAALSRWLDPVDIDSDEAERAREAWSRRRNWQEDSSAGSSSAEPVNEVKRLLATRRPPWNQLAWLLAADPKNGHQAWGLVPDIIECSLWPQLSVEIQRRICEVALEFLQEEGPGSGDWVGTKTISHAAVFGYRALLLLNRAAPDLFQSLSGELLVSWAPTIAGFPLATGVEEWEAPHRPLLEAAYRAAPENFLHALSRVLDLEASEKRPQVTVHRKLEAIDDDRIVGFLVEKLGSPGIAAAAVEPLLSSLLRRGAVKEAFALACGFLDRGPEDPELAAAAGRALFLQASRESWAVLWPRVRRDDGLCQAIFPKVLYDSVRRSQILADLAEDALGDLFAWLENLYPGDRSPFEDGVGFVTVADNARQSKYEIVKEFESRGTPEAVRVLGTLTQRYSQLEWLRWSLQDAAHLLAENSWNPPSTDELLKLLEEEDASIISSPSGLLSVLETSLRRMEQDLQGPTPGVQFLWEGMPGAPRPKDEHAFSDWVKRWLESDLRGRELVVNREVEIRSASSGRRGQKLDILVQAIHREADRPIGALEVYIEVKCCWNPGLFRDMKRQLVGRYLANNPMAAGLYLVGWFDASDWDPTDSRKGRAVRAGSVTEIQEELCSQAESLSSAANPVRAQVIIVSPQN